jgi:hypothetical protein
LDRNFPEKNFKMKKIPCGYENCSQRRAHFTAPDVYRPHQTVEVDDDYEGKAYCSFSCAILAGEMKMKNEKEAQVHKRSEYIVDESGRCWLPPVESRMEGWARHTWFRKKTGLEGHSASKELWKALSEKYQIRTTDETK